ncbi:hypothetical protein DO97_10790 [Neosynechococcus sphagnicola sy1]|uniref:Uncharacterized protein n=1 Tax=Neosynechococcus sphagnicola sy1 TaxID=1497020 RepID=A0A098TKB6_9CYAN|nr:hypothetical protein [Neosynechococcus sphagnicola]KGF72287.1 hypothetical protein DO97_10790 [Neosynechococcus sphagnicola sy1]
MPDRPIVRYGFWLFEPWVAPVDFVKDYSAELIKSPEHIHTYQQHDAMIQDIVTLGSRYGLTALTAKQIIRY